MKTHSAHRGFTLIELMITLSVMALVLTLGVPNFRTTILDNRQVSELNSLIAALNLARSDAVARNTWVSVSPISGSDWSNGWFVFVNRDGQNSFNGTAGTLCENSTDVTKDCELRTYPALPNGLTLRFPRTRITFDSLGAAQGFTGTFVFCDGRGAKAARGAILANNGRLKPTRDEDHDGYQDNSDGSHLSCP